MKMRTAALQYLLQRHDVRRTPALAPDQHRLRAVLGAGQTVNAQTLPLRERREDALGDERYPHARDDASQHGVIGRQLDGALRHLPAACIPVFEPFSMRASVLENNDGPWQTALSADGRMTG